MRRDTFLDRMENIMEKNNTAKVSIFTKIADIFKEKTKNVKWKEVWDKVTTGILIFLFASPILILGYIFLWFILK